MTTTTYEPDLYDLTTPVSFRGDLEFYRRKAKESGGPVLELGAGTGRITIAIARDGVAIHALDANQAMLGQLRRKSRLESPAVQARIGVVEGDMRTFELPERFALVISPFRAFLHNLTEGDRLACLARVRHHLWPGGRFAFNVFYPTLEYMSHHTGAFAGTWRWVATFPRPDGGWIDRSDANRYDPVRQLVRSQLRYDDFGADGILRRTFVHRLELAYLYPPDLRRLLEDAGFDEIQIAGGADGKPVQDDRDELFVEAVSP